MIKKTAPRKIGKKRRARIDSGGSEFIIFKTKVLPRANHPKYGYRCELTARIIPEESILLRCFPHILSKGMWPEHRLDPNNIIFVADQELHQEVDRLASGKAFELSERLKEGESLVPIIQSLFWEKYPQYDGCLE